MGGLGLRAPVELGDRSVFTLGHPQRAIMSKSIFIGSAAAEMYFQMLATDNYASNKNKPFLIGMLQKNHPFLYFPGKARAPAFTLWTTCASDDVSDDKELSILNRPSYSANLQSKHKGSVRFVRKIGAHV